MSEVDDSRGELLTQIMEDTEEAMRKGLSGFVGKTDAEESCRNIVDHLRDKYGIKRWWEVLKEGIRLSFGRGQAEKVEHLLKEMRPNDMQELIDTVGFCFPLLELEFFRRSGVLKGWSVKGQVPGDHPDVILELNLRHPQGNLMLKGYLLGEDPG